MGNELCPVDIDSINSLPPAERWAAKQAYAEWRERQRKTDRRIAANQANRVSAFKRRQKAKNEKH